MEALAILGLVCVGVSALLAMVSSAGIDGGELAESSVERKSSAWLGDHSVRDGADDRDVSHGNPVGD